MFASLVKRVIVAVLAICAVLAVLAAIDRHVLFDPSCRLTSAVQNTKHRTESARDACDSVVINAAYDAASWVRTNKDEINAISTLALAFFSLVLVIFTIRLTRSLRGPAAPAIPAVAAREPDAPAPKLDATVLPEVEAALLPATEDPPLPATEDAPPPQAQAEAVVAPPPSVDAARLFVEVVDETLANAVGTWLQFILTMKDGADIHAGKTVRLKFRNFGRSPAILKEISGKILIAPSLPDVPHYEPISEMPNERMVAEQGRTESITIVHTEDTPAEQSLAVIEGAESFFLFGRVIYDDIFGGEHEHRFLFVCNGVHQRLTFQPHAEYTRNT